MTRSKLIKLVIFVILLIAASCFFATICHQIEQLGGAILSPSWDILYPFLWLLLALALVAMAAGLVAALVHPLRICFIVFALSGLAVLLLWGIDLTSS
ncbi:hypothetical protein ACFLV5_05530, partial [Chloroflexota bacterium]